MAKDKKKTFGIKTTRYFTKTCTKCKFEYPNWFTNCPKCGIAWDETETAKLEESGKTVKKTIKIVVKITEEDFDDKLDAVKLIFSADNGKSWYQMKMENEMDYFIAEIIEVPIGSLVIYYIEVKLVNGEVVIENNDGKYFIYKVGAPLEKKSTMIQEARKTHQEEYKIAQIDQEKKITPKLSKQMFKAEEKIFQESIKPSKLISSDMKFTEPNDKGIEFHEFKVTNVQPPEKPLEYKLEDSITIFGRPQTQIDPELKICPHCNSKIKKMWSTCPICGKQI